MKKVNIIISIIMAIALLAINTGSSVLAIEKETNKYTIEEAWVYTVTPGMEEWETYLEPEQKMSASYVPEDILKMMTTNALVETVLNYPLLVDIYAFNTQYIGYQAVSSIFYGLPELASRSDAITALQNYNKEHYSNIDDIDIKYYYVNTLIDCIAKDTFPIDKNKYNTSRDPNSNFWIVNVYTPMYTAVEAYFYFTWDDVGSSLAAAEAIRDQYLITYPSTEVMFPVNPQYNCHSYAWYWSSSDNGYWINNPSAYMTDGSYKEALTMIPGAKIFYDNYSGTAFDHSAICWVAPSYPNPAKVIAKWGYCAGFSHYIMDCPYANTTDEISSWTGA